MRKRLRKKKYKKTLNILDLTWNKWVKEYNNKYTWDSINLKTGSITYHDK